MLDRDNTCAATFITWVATTGRDATAPSILTTGLPTIRSIKSPAPTAAAAPLYSDAVRFFDGSFVKIRNITLGYTIPKAITSKIKLNSLRLYATADNALIFSPYKLVDPETSNGIVGGGSPMTSATYVFGLNLKF